MDCGSYEDCFVLHLVIGVWFFSFWPPVQPFSGLLQRETANRFGHDANHLQSAKNASGPMGSEGVRGPAVIRPYRPALYATATLYIGHALYTPALPRAKIGFGL